MVASRTSAETSPRGPWMADEVEATPSGQTTGAATWQRRALLPRTLSEALGAGPSAVARAWSPRPAAAGEVSATGQTSDKMTWTAQQTASVPEATLMRWISGEITRMAISMFQGAADTVTGWILEMTRTVGEATNKAKGRGRPVPPRVRPCRCARASFHRSTANTGLRILELATHGLQTTGSSGRRRRTEAGRMAAEVVAGASRRPSCLGGQHP
mmetsp:Transcript_113847/g.367854  ORF Transcript_113847/g.367854 Transcript_113847/m.367854 type:complete len:214 (-) Transcript_113847:1036-1677(-)